MHISARFSKWALFLLGGFWTQTPGVWALTDLTPTADSSLLFNPGATPDMSLSAVPSGYDASVNFGNATATGVLVGGGYSPLPGGTTPLLAPGSAGGNIAVPWGQAGMVVPPLQAMMTPMQAGAMGVAAQLGPSANQMANFYGQTGTLGAAAYYGFPVGNMPPSAFPWNTAAGMGGPGMPYMMPNFSAAGGMGPAAPLIVPGISGASAFAGMGSSAMAGMNAFNNIYNGNTFINAYNNPLSLADMLGFFDMMSLMRGGSSAELGLPGNPLAGMGAPSALMMMSPQFRKEYDKREASIAAGTLRLLETTTNAALAKTDKEDLRKYQKSLQLLATFAPDVLPPNIDTSDIGIQLSRVTLALDDPATLLADPSSKTVPEKGLQAAQGIQLNELLSKWATPKGEDSSSTGLRPLVNPSFSTPATLSRTQNSAIAVFLRVHKQIESIEEDERLLRAGQNDPNSKKDSDMMGRIEQALYNTMIAKAYQYDDLMDHILRKDWEALIDQERGKEVSSTSLSLSRRSTPITFKASSRPSPPRSSSLPSATGKSDFRRDEVVELHRAMVALLDALNSKEDISVGGDAGIRAKLQVHIEKLEKVLAALNDPTKPNPFRTISPVMDQVASLWEELNKQSNADLLALKPDVLKGNIQPFAEILNAPMGKLPPQMKYSDVQSLYNKLVTVLAVQAYQAANNASAVGQYGSRLTRAIGSLTTRAKTIFGDSTQVEDYLEKGWYSRSDSTALDSQVTRDAAISLVESMALRYIAQQKRWWTKGDLDTRLDNAKRVSQNLLEQLKSLSLNAISVEILKVRYTISTLKQHRQTLLTFFLHGDPVTWVKAEEAQQEEALAEKAKKLGGSRPNMSTNVALRTGQAAGKFLSKIRNKKAMPEPSAPPKLEDTVPEKQAPLEESNEEAASFEPQVNSQEKEVREFLQNSAGISMMIEKLETAIAEKIMETTMEEAQVKENLLEAVGMLQGAYTYQYSGFLEPVTQEKFSRWTNDLIGKIDNVLLKTAQQAVATAT